MSPSATLKACAARWKFPMEIGFTNVTPQSESLPLKAPLENNKVAEDYRCDAFPITEGPTSFECVDLLDSIASDPSQERQQTDLHHSITSNLDQEQLQIRLQAQDSQQYTDESLLVSEFEDPSDLDELLVQNIEETDQSIDDKMISWIISESPAFESILDIV